MIYNEYDLREDIAELYRKGKFYKYIVRESFQFADKVMKLVEKYEENKKQRFVKNDL